MLISITFSDLFLRTLLFASVYCNSSQDKSEESKLAEELYVKLFKSRRVEQLLAIKNFRKISSYEKQYSMIKLMAEKIFHVIEESRATIEASPFIPGVSEFPLDSKIQDALSNILENTALFSEIVLRFPDIATSVLKSNNSYDLTLQWGIAFCNQMRYLLDHSTVTLLRLTSQELNHIPRDPNYVNPYRKAKAPKDTVEEIKSNKKKDKKKIKKGPKLSSHIEL